jgi:hypothetical protein
LLADVARKLDTVTPAPAKCDAHGVAHKAGSKAAQACADAQATPVDNGVVTDADIAVKATRKPAKMAKTTAPAKPTKPAKTTAQAKPATPAKTTARTAPKANGKATAPAARTPRAYKVSTADLTALQAANPALAARIAARRDQAARVNGR